MNISYPFKTMMLEWYGFSLALLKELVSASASTVTEKLWAYHLSKQSYAGGSGGRSQYSKGIRRNWLVPVPPA